MDFSIVIPAYNEELLLGETIKSIFKSVSELNHTYKWEILVVDNHSDDRTPEVAKELGCRVLFEPKRSIARARNHGASQASGEFLIFVDADTFVPTQTLCHAINLLLKKKVGYGGAKVCFDHDYGRIFAGKLIPALWNLISRNFGLFAGSFMFCRKDLFEFCGGFPEDFFAGEEIELAKKMKTKCKDLGWSYKIMTHDYVISSARKLAWYKDWDLLKMLLPLVLSTKSLQSQSRCAFWYQRP